LPIPFWNREGGLREAAAAEETRALAVRAETELRVHTEVLAALESYASARQELALLEDRVLLPARSNQRLLETAYDAGRLDLPTALLLRGQLLDAELEYWNAWLAERSARATLRATIGEDP
jgi:outer membrane protein TolC